METFLIISAAIVALLFWFYKSIYNEETLEQLGIVHEKPLPLVGNILPMLLQTEGGILFVERVYRLFPNDKQVK